MASWISGSSRISGGTWFRVLGVRRGVARFVSYFLECTGGRRVV